MAIIPQQTFFVWSEIENLGDLERLNDVRRGFEKDRGRHGTLRKLCPARQYGTGCKHMERCQVKGGIRIDISKDRRIFTPILGFV